MKILKQVLVIVVLSILLYLTINFNGCNPKDLQKQIVTLQVKNDSLSHVLNLQDQEILQMNVEELELTEKLQKAMENIKVVKVIVEKKVEIVKTYDSSDVVKFYAERYPNEYNYPDTLIPLNKLVLVSAASDLVEYDGAKQVVVLQDSALALQDKKLHIKDSMMSVMKSKEVNYKGLIYTKDSEINVLNVINSNLERDNKKLKKKLNVVKTVGIIVLGGLTYSILTK